MTAMTARRFARWLRLVVACLAFVVGNPAPAVAAVVDEIVLVANDDAREDAPATRVVAERATPSDEPVAVDRACDPPLLVSRRWLANRALLL